jgi:HemY protein
VRKYLLYFALSLVLGVALFNFIGKDSGYVLIAYGKTTIELSLWLALILFLILFFAFHQLIKLVYGTEFWLFRRAGAKTLKHTWLGLQHFVEGHWRQAASYLHRSADKTELSYVNLLLAAQASLNMGQYGDTEELLVRAERSNPTDPLATGLLRARMYFQREQWENALAILSRLRDIEPGHPDVLQMTRNTLEALNDWTAMLDLVPVLKKYQCLTKEDEPDYVRRVYENMIIEALRLAKNKPDPLPVLQDTWQQLPKRARQSRALVLIYAKALVDTGQFTAAETIVRETLKKSWSDDLVRLYGTIQGEDLAGQILALEGWMKKRPGNGAIHLAIGRLSLANRDWEKARGYLEGACERELTPEAMLELGRLLLAQGENERGMELINRALVDKGAALDLPLP